MGAEMDARDYYLAALQLLMQLGVRVERRRFQYLLSALVMVYEEPERLQLITKLIYPQIARKHHTSVSAAERGIRTAVESIWNCPNYPLLMEIVLFDRDRRPPAGLMLACLSRYLCTQTASLRS